MTPDERTAGTHTERPPIPVRPGVSPGPQSATLQKLSRIICYLIFLPLTVIWGGILAGRAFTQSYFSEWQRDRSKTGTASGQAKLTGKWVN